MGERRRDRKQRKLTKHQTNMQAQFAQQQWHQSQALIAEQRAQTELLRQQAAMAATAQQAQFAAQGPGRWHPDPVGRFAQRWWNGTEWTAHVVDGGGRQTTDPEPVNTVR